MSTFEIEMAEVNNEAAELLRNEEIKNSWKLRRQEKTKKKKVKLGYVAISRCIAILAIILLAGSITIWKTVFSRHHPPAPSNYTVALHQALMFFDAQRSGKLPEKNIVSWRGDSGLDDGQSKSSSIFKNLSGGYYYAGDAIKFNFPTSFAMTMLSWSVIEYSAKYEAAGELIHIKDIIKWGTDYFLKTFDSTAHSIDRIVQQVGNGDISGGRSANDRYCWMRPEDIDYDCPVIECQRCPDLAAEMATALASASIVFKDYKKYSGKLMRGAKTLFKFSQDQLNNNGSDIEATLSTNYWDEFIWGAAWLYYATGNISYLHLATSQEFAERAGAFRGGPLNGVLSWDNKLPGAQVLLTRLRLFRDPGYPYDDIMRTFDNQTRVFMCSYLSFFTHFKRTNGGLLELNHGAPQPLQYVVNAVFLARLYIDYLKAAGIAGWYFGPYFFYVTDLRKFAFVQMNYILGINPRNLSYVMGYGNDYPKQVHHRGASIPNDGKRYSCEGGYIWQDSPNPNPNPNTIIGAMVAGPDKNHGFDDLRSNYNFTEPTLAGNADLVAALVALSYEESMGIDNDLINYALPSGWFQSPPPPWQPGLTRSAKSLSA